MKKIFFLTAMVLSLASCTNSIDTENSLRMRQVADESILFYAVTEGNEEDGPETKVYADSQMRVLWNANDQITIFNNNTYNQPYRFTGRDGRNAGNFAIVPIETFSTSGPLDHIYAIYPYQESTEISYDGDITFTLPALQTYKKNSFGIGANTMVSVTDNTMLQFKNAGGYLEFKLYGEGISVKRIQLRGNNGEKLAGDALITMPLGGLPTVTMLDNATEEVTLECETPVALGTSQNDYTVFWFVLPPTSFTKGITVTVTDALGGTFAISTSKTVTVQRSYISHMAPLEVVPDYDHTFVPFEDANFKAYCVENFDTDGDGEISIAEASLIETISVNTDNITSLSGIEFFPNLSRLSCRGSSSFSNSQWTSKGQLQAIDISKNLKITDLDISSNQLLSLNVSNNSRLTQLKCLGNLLKTLYLGNNRDLSYLACGYNLLESLDVSNNSKLRILYCNNNQLTQLDLTNNTSIEGLSCVHNQLTELDLSHNTQLTQLGCSENQLTSLDLSNNKALTGLECQYNSLTSLDLSNNKDLWSVHCYNNHLSSLIISSNTALEWLYCANNKLTSLDVSNNIALDRIWCFNNLLTSLDVSNNSSLVSLWCTDCPYLTEIWLDSPQQETEALIEFRYDTNIATIKYKHAESSIITKAMLDNQLNKWYNDRDTLCLLFQHNAHSYHPLERAQDNLSDMMDEAVFDKQTLIKASENLVDELNGIIRHSDMSFNDSIALWNAMVQFAKARDAYLEYKPYSSQPTVEYDNKNLFYFTLAISPILLVDSISFCDLTFEQIRYQKTYEYNAYGQRVGSNSSPRTFVNIAEQLCGNKIANAIEGMGANNPLYPVSISDFNTAGFYGKYTYDNSNRTFLNKDNSEFTPNTIVAARILVGKAVEALNSLWDRFWGETLGASSDESGNVDIPDLDERYNPANYELSYFTEPSNIVSFSGDNIVWTDTLGEVLGAVDPNRTDSAGQSFNNNGIIHTTSTSATGFSAIFYGREHPTSFYNYMKALFNYNQSLE